MQDSSNKMAREDGRIDLDINTAVEELHRFSPHEMKKLLKDSQLSVRLKGAVVNVDVEKLASYLPLHLLASLASSMTHPRFSHLLRGVRLLHSLSILAARYPKLEQILLQEVKIREQILDFVIFALVVLANVEQDGRWGSILAGLHAGLVACLLHLLTAFVTPEWRDVVSVLLAHPKADVFMDAAFDALRKEIHLLNNRFKQVHANLSKEKTTAISDTEHFSAIALEHFEASLQVLQSLCEFPAFRDRVLSHKELCRKGGILSLVLAVLQLNLPQNLQHMQSLSATSSRLKSKILAMLITFCEAEEISFLDEVAADPNTMEIAIKVAKEIMDLVKRAFFQPFTVQMVHEDIDKCPTGMLYLNAMRLADVLSDDSNFRNLFMDKMGSDLASILAMDPLEFESKWCGGCSAQDMADCEIEATLAYDPFQGSGAALVTGPSASTSEDQGVSGCSLMIKQVEPAYYAQELSALLVKLFANLHCFNPDVCSGEERDRFLCSFMHYLSLGPKNPLSGSYSMTKDQLAVRVCENLHGLLDHVASFSTDIANDEDVHLASVFAQELHESFCLSSDDQGRPRVAAYVREVHVERLTAVYQNRESSDRWQRVRQMEAEADTAADMEADMPADMAAGMAVEQEPSSLPIPEEVSTSKHEVEEKEVQVQTEALEMQKGAVQLQNEAVQVQEEAVQVQEEAVQVHKEVAQAEKEVHVDNERKANEEAAKEPEHKQHTEEPEKTVGIENVEEKLIAESRREEVKEVVQEKAVLTEAPKDSGNIEPPRDSENLESFDNYVTDVPFSDPGSFDAFEDSGNLGPFQQDFSGNIQGSATLAVETVLTIPSSSLNMNLDRNGPMEYSSVNASEDTQRRLSLEDERVGGVRKFEDDGKVEPRKRQRRIMSENQIIIMEAALKQEPEMQRYADRVQHWTNALNQIGPEISASQLKNWINNRKAKLAKMAKGGRADPNEKVYRPRQYYHPEEQRVYVQQEPYIVQDSRPYQYHVQEQHIANEPQIHKPPVLGEASLEEPSVMQIGQSVMLKDDIGREIAVGITKAVTPGEEGAVAMCLVEIHDLRVDRSTKLPIGSDFMGTTFDEAEKKLGKLIVAWPANNVRLYRG